METGPFPTIMQLWCKIYMNKMQEEKLQRKKKTDFFFEVENAL